MRTWFELTDNPDSYMLLMDSGPDGLPDPATEIRVPLHRGSRFVVDTQRLWHVVVHGGDAPRYALICSYESGPARLARVDLFPGEMGQVFPKRLLHRIPPNRDVALCGEHLAPFFKFLAAYLAAGKACPQDFECIQRFVLSPEPSVNDKHYAHHRYHDGACDEMRGDTFNDRVPHGLSPFNFQDAG